MSATRRKAPRGQALVEMTLGVIVFVTILMIGIFFAEVGFLTQKVQEAANFAIWDATARRVHDIEGNDWKVLNKANKKGAVPMAEKEAQRRYRDFDGRSGHDRTGKTLMAFARADPIDVECGSNLSNWGVWGTGPRDADSASEGMLQAAMGSARADAGIACRARSNIGSVRIPKRFLDGQKLFKTKNWDATPIPICAVGRAKNGNCRGRLAILLDDWALQTRRDSVQCALNIDSSTPRCGNVNGNQSYYNWAQRIYTKFGGSGGAGQALVGSVKGGAPYEGQFFMSFRGYESPHGPFTENTVTNESGQAQWETTPFRAQNVYKRKLRKKNGWLGH